LRFESLRVPLAPPALAAHRARLDERPTVELMGSSDRPARAELQWRLGLPLMVLVGAACALPMGRLRPRQGRYAKVWQAVVLFAVYGNLTTAARTWYEHGVTPASLGLWWVHVLFVLFAVWLTWGGLSLFRRARR
jgi:lipopolysaccharide export system permease protein